MSDFHSLSGPVESHICSARTAIIECATAIAARASDLAAKNRTDKFSFLSEYRFVFYNQLGIPSNGNAGSILPVRRDLSDFPAEMRPPKIPCVSDIGRKRPQWTVIIPASDPDPTTFPALLAMIIGALSEAGSWEILIADDASECADVGAIVREFSKYPIHVIRFDIAVGPVAATNECLRRSRGQLVHIFSQDGIVLKDFYTRLGQGLKKHPQAAVAACGHQFCDRDHSIRIHLEITEPCGCYGDSRFAATWAYRAPFSGVVVRRSLYEALGGFHEHLGLWAEWEMKARLLSATPLYFHNTMMVVECLHAASYRQRILHAADTLDACAKAISLATKCYPETLSKEFSEKSSVLFASEFVCFGLSLITYNQIQTGLIHLQAAIQLWPGMEISEIIKKRMFHLLKSQGDIIMPENQVQGEEANAEIQSTGDFFPEGEFQELEAIVSAYRSNPSDEAATEQVRSLRNGLCEYLLNSDKTELEILLQGNFGKMFFLLRAGGITVEELGDAERDLVGRAKTILADTPSDPAGLLAWMLLRPAHWVAMPINFVDKPDWLLAVYLDYILASAEGFVHPGESDMYFDHLSAIFVAIERDISRSPLPTSAKWSAFQIAQRVNLIPVYFSQRDMKDLMRSRARVLAFLLSQHGHRLEASFPPRPFHRKKIRVGFLSAHLGPQTETYTSAPFFYLDREKFDIHLFVLGNNPSTIESHCRSVSDSFTVLPTDLVARVNALRTADLDVLVIATNMTAVTNETTILGMHRLAPIQIASNSSAMTPGLPYLDGFLAGLVHGYEAYAGQYNERLFLFDGALSCLEYSVDRPKAERSFSRSDFGIPEGVPLFVSGANFFKILPELQATWAQILKRVPGSYLLLHPFNPNWTNCYPVARFRRDIFRAFELAGVDSARIIISEETLPTRADVCQLMALGDVYLDSYPFSGSVSLIDPLEAGVPPVAWWSASTRGLMAASMLSDLDLRELVAESEEEFITTAVRLATEPQERERISKKIRAGMAAGPRFYDVKKYGSEVSRVLEELVLAERKTEKAPDNKELVRRAELALSASRFDEAEDLCRQVLERDPETAACWAILATLARRSGDLTYAAELMEQTLALQPQKSGYWIALGDIRRENKDLEGALAALQRAVELRPNLANAWLSLAIVHDERKEAADAEKAYNQALRHAKDHVETAKIRINFAGFLREQKRMSEGIKQLHKAVSDVPQSAETWILLGSFLREGGDFPEAISTFARASKKFPKDGKILLEWGKVLFLLDKNEESLEKTRKAVSLLPNDPAALFNLGYALQKNLQRTEALKVYLEAEAAGCDTADLHTNIGVILKDQERYMEAAQRFHKTCGINPESHAAMNNLGAVCINLGLTTEAINCFEHALRLNPTMTAPHNNLGHMLKISGKAAEGLEYYVKGLRLAPDNKEMMHNYLLCTLYQTNLSPQDVFEEHRKWGALIAAGIKRLPHRNVGDGHPQGKIRIGYISPDFCMHPVAFFALALLGGLDRGRFETYAYSDVHKADAMTNRLRALVDVWRDVSEMQNQDVGELIQKDQIDLLVDLCGHTANNRLEVMAAKPAPIIVSYLGYPATTGMPGVGFRLTDAIVDPPGKTDSWHTEKLVRLDRCAWCFEAPASSPPVGPLPAKKNGFITFGCFNNLAKLNAPLYDVWVEILRNVPDSRLFLKAKTFIDPGICEGVVTYFTAQGIALDRLRVSGFEAVAQNHFDRYNEVDIALDSYPYHGTTTTCEALWMGAPVITRAGEAHISRVGASLLQAVGHPELVATTDKEYIRLAVDLARDLPRLEALRMSLRPEMMSSPLLDKKGFSAAIEKAFDSLLPQDKRIGQNFIPLQGT